MSTRALEPSRSPSSPRSQPFLRSGGARRIARARRKRQRRSGRRASARLPSLALDQQARRRRRHLDETARRTAEGSRSESTCGSAPPAGAGHCAPTCPGSARGRRRATPASAAGRATSSVPPSGRGPRRAGGVSLPRRLPLERCRRRRGARDGLTTGVCRQPGLRPDLVRRSVSATPLRAVADSSGTRSRGQLGASGPGTPRSRPPCRGTPRPGCTCARRSHRPEGARVDVHRTRLRRRRAGRGGDVERGRRPESNALDGGRRRGRTDRAERRRSPGRRASARQFRTGPPTPPSRPLRRRYTGPTMKTEIHPTYRDAHVRCTCGNEFTTRSVETRSTSRSARTAIPSTRAGRSSWTPAVASSASSAAPPDARPAPPPSGGAGPMRRPGEAVVSVADKPAEAVGARRARPAARRPRRAGRRPGRARGRDDARHQNVGRRRPQALAPSSSRRQSGSTRRRRPLGEIEVSPSR